MDNNSGIILFQDKQIRRRWYRKKWYLSVTDIIAILTNSVDPSDYWFRMKDRMSNNDGAQLSTICREFKLKSVDGKMRKTDCANSSGLLRIIQSIPSPKAEPFKLWLAQVGKERLDEIENPELAQERMKKIYEAKGYPKGWIEKRLRGIAIRQELTDEWKERGIKNNIDYAILTSEISKATFGMTPTEYRKYKNIPKKSNINLRDNMTDLELIFTMLGEKVTTEISQNEKPESFIKSRNVAIRGGNVAGSARIEAEREIGKKVSTRKNFLHKRNIIKKLK